MLLFENISLAVTGLLANKMRALLTMLGIIIGIGAVIAIMTVGDSMTNSLTDSMQSMGATNITVSLTQKSDSDYVEGGNVQFFRDDTYSDKDLMTDEMIEDFRIAFGDQVDAVSLTQSVGSASVKIGENEAEVSAMGVNLDYEKAENVTLIRGRFFTQEDITQERAVAVVSDKFCQKLFGLQEEYIGQSFQYTNGNKIHTFYIVGVYEYEDNGMAMFATDSDPVTNLYMPVSTAKKITHSADGYSQITVVGAATADANLLSEQAELFFASYYTRNNSYTVTAYSMQSMLESMEEMMGTVSLAISVIAGISLLVGGIGVMNIMLVSITERTREIGTRKALGATNSSIRIQFIVESVIICLIGGILGVITGLALGAGGVALLGYSASPSISVILLAVLFSMAIGIFFGYYPANKAAKMNPIEALRYE